MNYASFGALPGTPESPSFHFVDSVGAPIASGLFLKAGGEVGIAVDGVEVGRLNANGFVQSGPLHFNVSVANNATGSNQTYTAAQLVGGLITRDPAGGARTDTTDTAANIIAAMGADVQIGDSFICFLVNTADAAEAITLAGGTDVTISNVGQTVAQNESAILLFRVTSASTMALYIFGA